MNTIFVLVNRNRKLFFRDKGMLISALITPLILIVLYGTFLANVYKDSFRSSLPAAFTVADKLINGAVAAQLAAGLLAVSCVTECTDCASWACASRVRFSDSTSRLRSER